MVRLANLFGPRLLLSKRQTNADVSFIVRTRHLNGVVIRNLMEKTSVFRAWSDRVKACGLRIVMDSIFRVYKAMDRVFICRCYSWHRWHFLGTLWLESTNLEEGMLL